MANQRFGSLTTGRRRRGTALVLAAVFAAAQAPTALAADDLPPGEPCSQAESIAFDDGSFALDARASAELAEAAGWLERTPGRYLLVSGAGGRQDPLAPLRALTVTEQLRALAAEPGLVRAGRAHTFGGTGPGAQVPPGLEDIVVLFCQEVPVYARDWSVDPEAVGAPAPEGPPFSDVVELLGFVFLVLVYNSRVD